MALLAVLMTLLIAAPVLRIPYPIFLVLGGLALGFVPGMPSLTLPPDVVLVAVLPPLLYLSAYRTSLRDLRSNARAIGILAIGLVIATTVTVAVVAHQAIDHLSWSVAFALGAVVTAGVYLGWRTPELTSVQSRLQGEALWTIVTFVLNALVFALVGLQLSGILDTLTGISGRKLAWYGLLVTGTVILTRVVWLPIFAWRNRHKPFTHTFLISWAGMRGAVSLAAALALPLTTRAGAPFPHRDLIIFLTFCVILGTLVVKGLSLPALIRALKIEPDTSEEVEDAQARIRAAEAALARLDELIGEDWVRDDTAERL